MTEDEAKVRMNMAKLQVALSHAPKPCTKPSAEWMVLYMDWYFQMRQSALANT